MSVSEALTFRGGTTPEGRTWADALTTLADEVERLRPIEAAARAAYPKGVRVLYFRPNAPKLRALRAALYGTGA